MTPASPAEPASLDPPRPPGSDSLAAAIQRNARRFDVRSLLSALRLLAERRAAERRPPFVLRYRGAGASAAGESLFERIDIHGDPAPPRDPEIHIFVNSGLLSTTSPLPSYFADLLSDPRTADALQEILEAADGALLPRRMASFCAATDGWITREPLGLSRRFFEISRPGSPATLHWLFRSVYPELAVSVRTSVLPGSVPAPETCIGVSALGATTLGGEARVPVAGYEVALSASPPAGWTDTDAASFLRPRMRRTILPALAGTGVFLRVLFVDPDHAGRLALASSGRLGLDPLGTPRRPFVSVVFEGRAPGPIALPPESRERGC
jgi:hypothetical protein